MIMRVQIECADRPVAVIAHQQIAGQGAEARRRDRQAPWIVESPSLIGVVAVKPLFLFTGLVGRL